MTYTDFLQSKIVTAPVSGFTVRREQVNPALKPHQRDAVIWACRGGRRALFESFGLGKTVQELEFCRLVIDHGEVGKALIVLPLGVRQEFYHDAVELLGMPKPRYITATEQADEVGIYLTNYERVRDGGVDPQAFGCAVLDEAAVLRSFGSKTYQTFLPLFRGVRYKLVATATPAPNRLKELIHYAGFLEIMDTGQALTRFFQRDSTKANNLTLLNNYYDPGKYHFDHELADRHVEFIERFCKVPSGKGMGQPLKLELFQRARLQAIFGFVDDNGLRQYNECLIIEGRKNGKTTETSAVELDLLVNDGEGSPQIYNVATDLDQAKLGFNAAHKMVIQSPLLARHVKKRTADLYCHLNLGTIRALASDSNSMDGLDVHGAVIDELSAIKKRDIYDLVKQGMGARSQPLLFCISTNGFVRESIFDAQYDYAKNVLPCWTF